MYNLIGFAVLLVLGYSVGRFLENKHYKSILEREKNSIEVPITNFKKPMNPKQAIESSQLVTGSVVISSDYFKTFLAGLRNIFGGNISSFESLIDRGRREAMLRMRAEAPESDAFINLRIETSSISKGRGSLTVEVLAMATALTYKKED